MGRARLTHRERFDAVAQNESWKEILSVSGPGSELDSGSVLHSLDVLDQICRDLDIRSIADIPCGDFHWIHLFLQKWPDISYVGYDVSPTMIDLASANGPGRRFELLDVTKETPAAADLIFCKDFVNHIERHHIWAALRNMSASGSRWIMITSNRGCRNRALWLKTNSSSRKVDLSAHPYKLPEPIYSDHYLSVWKASDIAVRVAERDRNNLFIRVSAWVSGLSRPPADSPVRLPAAAPTPDPADNRPDRPPLRT